uniref:EamA domain-containing protein n=1 Tax=Grammatophora oceanica TaxID=210454 RepID=A0A7S1UNM3_9STRA|mmetsp:Transcript_14426/g.21166  ORF Transcript_14426/g.21166 Transcript_14426/m.21166 type:complete len:154 (+) Transcript_14426:35-496(+)|eukprot:CAMPEP_0194041982 /NCGR_PEP_ID=MMETSP0009_2-20130614/13786_1 /TAXON_ID=210454 /ORGANISM="Grammatophora oceanica, Strain CCMP 410" /LENGTH=153 /DNA_ID=CAMNT_0038685647 /DNA_START=35 /DNA_END=496 /DNA_ORIENTATION=-
MELKIILSLILVGAFWGCTNPLLRKGSTAEATDAAEGEHSSSSLLTTLSRFRNWKVWLPYLLNQSGSLLYYVLLANSDLTLAVPICNALSLVFSMGTSHLLGERVDKPLRAGLGAAMVMMGVTLCVTKTSGSEGESVREEEEVTAGQGSLQEL